VGDARRRVFCWRGVYPDRCNDLFYEAHYRAWSITKRAVLRRVRARFAGSVRCERCKRDPDLVTPGQTSYEFDHIREIAADGDAFDPQNVQLLCLPCHRRKTAAFLRRGVSATLPPLLHQMEDFA
jgi:5-methylcytosine-specific restriction endonuclease McrA